MKKKKRKKLVKRLIRSLYELCDDIEAGKPIKATIIKRTETPGPMYTCDPGWLWLPFDRE